MKPTPDKLNFRKGFTLVELLAVVAVLGGVAILLYPVFQRAVASSKASACANNMRTYGLAVQMYMQENGGRLPDRRSSNPNPPLLRYGNWVKPYLGRKLIDFRCPLATATERRLTSGFTYCGNGALTEYYPDLKELPAPASRVVLAAEMYDWTQGFYVAGHFNRTIWGNGNGGANPADEGTARRAQYHGTPGKRGLFLFFLDGHVQLVSAPNNDWTNSPTLGDATNGGYFYTTKQFNDLRLGKLVIQ